MSRFAHGALAADVAFRPVASIFVAPGGHFVSAPDGATACLVQCTAGGGSADANNGGGGAAWSEAAFSISPGATLYVEVGGAGEFSRVRANNVAGAVLCAAEGGRLIAPGLAANGVGQRKQSGGTGANAGGGAAGIGLVGATYPIMPGWLPPVEVPMDGGNADGGVPGLGYGLDAGDGGKSFGGGGNAPNGPGRSGRVILFWS